MPDSINKDALYGKFQAGEDRKAKQEDEKHALGMTVARKALDVANIPVDDMNIKANTTNINGVGTRGLIGMAAAASLPLAAVLGLMMYQGRETAPVAPTPPVPTAPAPGQPTMPTADIQDYDAWYYIPLPDGTKKFTRTEPLTQGGKPIVPGTPK